ncbi:MAG: dihydropteroate synthase [Lentisphaerae bacterium]|nr:dihydropteroate synthase [Lentisphaerota bacterium]
MKLSKFISVGENIHCTRILKVGGKHVTRSTNGEYVINFQSNGNSKQLPVPEKFQKNADWESGKLKHCAAAIWQGNYGNKTNIQTAIDYLQSMARAQQKAGATYLDINVDEFSTDIEERIKLMKWIVDIVQKAVSIPMSIDSSNANILRAGLEACDKFKTRGKPMMNSVSLERAETTDIASEFGAVVIASATGETSLPSTKEERILNLDRLLSKLTNKASLIPIFILIRSCSPYQPAEPTDWIFSIQFQTSAKNTAPIFI